MKTNITNKLEKIDKDHYQLLLDIGTVAESEKQKAYLVGGMVRDLLLGYDNLDIDIVVENNAKLLGEALAKEFLNCEFARKHDKFHTAKLIFTIDGKKVPVDLASTREEIYEFPASLPTVKVSNLKKDLYRRDFTINALAVSLMPDDFGEIVDLFDSLIDLKNKKIRVLHNLSFIDDPTRMIRAVRFACKLGFEIEEYTRKLLKEAIDSRQFDNLIEKIRGDRVKIEIRYLFNLLNVEEAIKQFFESGVYRMVSLSLRGGQSPSKAWGARNDSEKQWLIVLALVMKDLPLETQEKIMNNLQMTSDEKKLINLGFTTFNRLQTLAKNNQKIDSVTIYRELKDLALESIQLVKLFNLSSHLSSLISEFLDKTSKIKLEITGDDLKKMGIKEGEKIGEILEKILEGKIKNPQMKKEDEMREVENLIRCNRP